MHVQVKLGILRTLRELSILEIIQLIINIQISVQLLRPMPFKRRSSHTEPNSLNLLKPVVCTIKQVASNIHVHVVSFTN